MEVPRLRVLVVEDERVLADAIATGLRREAMAVDVAYGGAGALERTGSGSGLGLSIVAAVASAHGGQLRLAARPGGGLRVTISLPLAVAVPA
jgi:signal transduction histidine kinase